MKNSILLGICRPMASFLFLLFFLISCESPEDVQPSGMLSKDRKGSSSNIIYGRTMDLWGGTARVWVERVQGKPTAIGIELSADALENLPHEVQEIALPLPGPLHATGYKTIMIGWNPEGHEPEGVYTLPHFDFHFYMITEGQIHRIMGGIDPGGYDLLARGVFPDVYTFGPVPFAVPHMGLHWSDITSPEFSPAGFSKTFIYGSNKDKVTFLEPMITLAYLQSLAPGTSVESPVRQLLIHDTPAYYPTSYTITRTGDSYIIALTDLVWRGR
ncbi:hypothetical protein [Rufibacter roseolus]|uniref:hypothetical protein n=1 Tax=Rufibacter roseolus TaxID=2817375 RepID=UPI001B3074E5|nr:hypothetical protein [Rufibacter roseolus]